MSCLVGVVEGEGAFVSERNYVKLSGLFCSWEFPNYLISLIMFSFHSKLGVCVYALLRLMLLLLFLFYGWLSVCLHLYVWVIQLHFHNFTFFLLLQFVGKKFENFVVFVFGC